MPHHRVVQGHARQPAVTDPEDQRADRDQDEAPADATQLRSTFDSLRPRPPGRGGGRRGASLSGPAGYGAGAGSARTDRPVAAPRR